MRKIGRGLFVLGAAVFFMQGGCSKSSQSSEEKKAEDAVAVPVEVAQVSTGDIAAYFTGSATLEAEEETEVVAKVGGVVKEILVEEGDRVEAGQILAVLDGEKLAAILERERANLLKLESNFERARELFDKELMSAQEFQTAKYEYEFQREAFRMTELDLHYTEIRTPIRGVVAQRLIKVGNMVLLNQATFRVTGLNPLLAMFHVPERHVTRLEAGQAAALTIDALDGKDFIGRVERISPVVDPATGTIKVTIAVDDASGELKPGMFARIRITYDVHANAVLLPKDALITEDRESAVFVVADSVARRRIVQTGYTNGNHVEITTGLSPGEMVVTTGKGSLKDSSRVELVSNGKEM
jgi:RND family efflux transporter MFP subunit